MPNPRGELDAVNLGALVKPSQFVSRYADVQPASAALTVRLAWAIVRFVGIIHAANLHSQGETVELANNVIWDAKQLCVCLLS